VADDLAVLSSGSCGDLVCTSLDPSTAGTRLLGLQQQLPPIDVKTEGCCPSIRNVTTVAAFPPHAVFDATASVSREGVAVGQAVAASEEIRKGVGQVKQRLQQVRAVVNQSCVAAHNKITCSFLNKIRAGPTTRGSTVWILL
jgi:hypothetical protein